MYAPSRPSPPLPSVQTLVVEIVTRDQLAHRAAGADSGFAHIGFADHPAEAPGHLDFLPLRLFAEGHMAPGTGFDMHAHTNVENVFVMLRGACRHRDSEGRELVLRAGDVSVLSAGSGFEHAEHVVGDEPAEALVVWFDPDQRDTRPRYSLRRSCFEPGQPTTLLASGRVGPDARVAPLRVDASLTRIELGAGESYLERVQPERRRYLMLRSGVASVNGRRLGRGDRALVRGSGDLRVHALDAAELFMVDMPQP